jgi:sporulation protein YlmC with PRC-barrel domain
MYNTHVLSAGTIKGDTVVNKANEELGKIEEIMLDASNGNVAYAVLSFGGFLGLGDKFFAIPWESLTLDKENHTFILDKTKEELEDAPGFDKANWPQTGDGAFLNSVYEYYGARRYWDM